MRLGLEAIDEVCARLGRPEQRVASVLVAGTNGKGSTAATLASIADAAGWRTGLYTSPHLMNVTERIRFGPEDVAPEELETMLAEVFAAADREPAIPVTYFEVTTVAAFLGFARRRLDLGVLEVGLGGRFDATNLAPAGLSVVTSIGLDHVAELGPTLFSIATEKAGIFRAGRPALVAEGPAEARAAFVAAAARAGASLHEMAEECAVSPERVSLEGTRFRLSTPVGSYALETPLPGRHQAYNAAAAVRAAELLAPALRVGADAVARGVASVRWPGRLERFRLAGKDVLLDGCHNPDGASALARFVGEAGLSAELIFGAMADKDVAAMMAALAPAFRSVRLVPIPSERAASPEELAQRVAGSRPDAIPEPSLQAALVALVGGDSETIIVAGSLYLVGEARSLLLSGRL